MAAPVRFIGLPPVQPQFEIRPPSIVGPPPSEGAPPAKGVGQTFSDYLEAQINHVNRMQREADTTVASVATGQSNNVHEMMIALDKADVSFRMLARLRNKVVDAYQEIMRLSV